MNAENKIGFDDDGRPVHVTDFDFAALEAERRDHKNDVHYYRDKLVEFVRFTCDALLAGNPSAEIAGRRAYFFALLLKQPPFSSQAELARHLGLSGAAVCQQLNAFKAETPLFAALNP